MASGCSSASHQPPPPAVHGSAPRADFKAGLAIVRGDEVFAKVLAGTPYRVTDEGTFEGPWNPTSAKPDLVGVFFLIDLSHPRRVDIRVPSIVGPWPRGTRHFDPDSSYVQFESQLTGTIVDLMVFVDLRSRAVVAISPGVRSREASLRQLTDPALLPPIDPTPE